MGLQAVVHIPLRQQSPPPGGQGQTPIGPSAPDPSGVLATAALNCASAPMLIPHPSQRHRGVQ